MKKSASSPKVSIKVTPRGKKSIAPMPKAACVIPGNARGDRFKAHSGQFVQSVFDCRVKLSQKQHIDKCTISEPFIIDQTKYIPKKQLKFDLTYPDGYNGVVCAYCEELKQSTWSEKWMYLDRDIKEWLAFLYSNYVGVNNSLLTQDAIELKNSLRVSLETTKCL
jgi:hypothetical protein